MRVTILDLVGKLLGVQFHIYGLPHGASHRRSVRNLSGDARFSHWGPPTAEESS